MYLLDSSAWLAHLFGEPGFEEVSQLFDDADVSISALSLVEVFTRLKSKAQEVQWLTVWETYSLLFARILAADEVVAHQALSIRSNTPERLPTVDGIIAATAAIHGLILVHRDPHFVHIPQDLLKQMRLPDK